METIIKNIKTKLTKLVGYYTKEIIINDTIGVLLYIHGNEKVNIEQYIFDNKSRIYKELFPILISMEKENEDLKYPNIDFFYLTVRNIEKIICSSVLEEKFLNIETKHFFGKCLSAVSEYYYSLENEYQEFIFEHERSQRKRLDYPLEAYKYKRSDGLPIWPKSQQEINKFYGRFYSY